MGLILALCAGFILQGLRRPEGAVVAVVWVDGAERARLPLSLETNAVFNGLALRIAQREVRVVSSACPRHLCAHAGAIRRPGATLACVPQRVLIELRAVGEEGLDAIAR